jgi:hypothetical protein
VAKELGPRLRGDERREIPASRKPAFVSYAAKTTDTTSELYGWMRCVFVTFRELEVRLLLGEIAPQLRCSA